MLELRYELEPDRGAPAVARRALAGELEGAVDEKRLDSLLIVVSELIANGVIHGPGRPISLEVTVDRGGSIRGEVRDEGDGVVAIREELADDDSGGRGLRLVDALSTRWGAYEGSTHVWFEIATCA